MPAPAPARSYERKPVVVDRIILLPDPWSAEVWRLDLGPDAADQPPGLVVGDTCNQWNGQFGDVAFGWARWAVGAPPYWRDDHVPLINISDQSFHPTPWPTTYASIPAMALRAGDFDQVTAGGEAY
ncbi:hypothetical protein [Plantactinospora sp. GCM10030261]|uniref:hypothetical protein n=1 Tax=Plantactinospora sp. GCM10030261 TaxID=3273420 RepID=UPI003612CF44